MLTRGQQKAVAGLIQSYERSVSCSLTAAQPGQFTFRGEEIKHLNAPTLCLILTTTLALISIQKMGKLRLREC